MAAATAEQFSCFGAVQFAASVHIFSQHLHQNTRFLDTWRWRPWGVSWVACFFVLSGFKLTYSQLKKKDPTKLEPFVPFLWRRVMRLVPIYYLSMILTFTIWAIWGRSAFPIAPYWINLPFNLVPVYTWIGASAGGWHAGWHGTHWYLCDLIFHQILWRHVYPLVNKTDSVPLLVLTMVACVMVTVARCLCIQFGYAEQEVTYYCPYTFNQFLSGMCLAKLRVLRSEARGGGAPGDWIALVLGHGERQLRVPLSGLLALTPILLAFEIPSGLAHVWLRNGPWSGILLPFHLLLVWCLTLEEGPLDWLCQRFPFSWMGELSYGVYMFHWNTIQFIYRDSKKFGKQLDKLFPKGTVDYFLFWCCLVPPTVLVSILAAVCWDRPIQAWSSRFLRSRLARSSHEKAA